MGPNLVWNNTVVGKLVPVAAGSGGLSGAFRFVRAGAPTLARGRSCG